MEEQSRPHKRFYKHAPLSWVHLKIYLAIILGQFVCGYAIQISGTAITAAQKVMPISEGGHPNLPPLPNFLPPSATNVTTLCQHFTT